MSYTCRNFLNDCFILALAPDANFALHNHLKLFMCACRLFSWVEIPQFCKLKNDHILHSRGGYWDWSLLIMECTRLRKFDPGPSNN